jgi:NAD(P)H dehydrogenase (quinone)
MLIPIPLAHPNPGSFDYAIATMATEALGGTGHRVVFPDLCRKSFAPVILGSEGAEGAVLGPALVEPSRLRTQ